MNLSCESQLVNITLISKEPELLSKYQHNNSSLLTSDQINYNYNFPFFETLCNLCMGKSLNPLTELVIDLRVYLNADSFITVFDNF